MDIIDFHTHDTGATSALISVDPRQFDPQPGKWYSLGYHPWHEVDKLTDDDFALLQRCASHDQVLAIGETGMDSLRGASRDVQAQVFTRHLTLAAILDKPVVVHCVRTAQDILTSRHKAGLDTVAMAIHGFRGNVHVARTLLAAGCYLSFGHQFNPAALEATPPDRLLIETDDSATSINDVASIIASTLHLSVAQVKTIATHNATTFLSRSH